MAGTNEIRVGLAERVITPPLGVEMAGYAARKGGAEGVHDDLHARAMVIETSETAVGILSAAIIGCTQEVVDAVRAQVEQRTGLTGAHLMLGPTHTHQGPKVEGDYEQRLVERCADCVAEAWETRKPARLGVDSTSVEDIGRNRRRLLYGGLPVDPEVGIVKVEDPSGTVRGVLYNHPCHPTTRGADNLQISEDWVHWATAAVREAVGKDAVVMFVNGAEGNVNPGYDAGLSAIGAHIPLRTWAHAEKIGTRLGRAVAAALPGIRTEPDLLLRSVSKRVDLPLRKTFPLTLEEATRKEEAAKAALETVQTTTTVQALRDRAGVDAFFAEMVRKQAERFASETPEPSVSVELQSIRLGGAVLTSFPGEVFMEFGLAVKQGSPFRPTLVVGLANGNSGGYLPTREAFEEGDYEVYASRYAPEAGDVLVAETLAQLKALAE